LLAKLDSLGGVGVSDAFRILAIVGAYSYAGGTSEFCQEHFVRPKAMEEVRLLRSQLGSLVLSILSTSADASLAASLNSHRLAPPSVTQFKVIRQLLASIYIDQVAVRADLVSTAARSIPELADLATEGRLKSKWKSCRYVPYLAMGVQGEAAYIHPSSALFEHSPPEWCVFGEVSRSRPKDRRKADQADDAEGNGQIGMEGEGDGDLTASEKQGRVFLKSITTINPAWIPKLGKGMCTFSKPVALDPSNSKPMASLQNASNAGRSGDGMVAMTPTYGVGPACEPSERATMIGWELPPVKAKRVWTGGMTGWRVDIV